MKNDEIFLLKSEIEIRRQAAAIRAHYLREMFAGLGTKIRAAIAGRSARKNGQKIGNRVGGATA